MKTAIFTFAIITMLSTTLAHADALSINPGLWEVTNTSSNPMSGQLTTKTEQECIVDDKFDPIAMMGGEQGCEVVDSQLEGNTLTFTVSCSMQGGQGTMSGFYQIDGDTGSGNMNMKLSFNGQTMTSESSSKAKRLGDC